MITIIVKKLIKEEKLKEALGLYRELTELSRMEEGCISYNVYQDETQATVVAIVEEWESKEAIERHNQTDHFNRIVPLFREMTQTSEVNTLTKLF